MKHFPITNLFMEARKNDVNENTLNLYRDRIDRILDEWELDYNVSIVPFDAYGEHLYRIQGVNKTMLSVWRTRFNEKLAPSSINNYASAIRSFLRWCYEGDVLVDDDAKPINDDLSVVIKTVKVPTQENLPEWERPVRTITPSNVEVMFAKLGEGTFAARNQAIAAVILFSGLRSSEVCDLTMKGVLDHRAENLIHCRRKGGNWCYVEAPNVFYTYLDRYLENRVPCVEDEDYLFTSYSGKHLSRIDVYRIVAPVQKSLNIKSGGHALRAAFASEVERIGGVAIARDTLNHKSITVTNRYLSTTHEDRLHTVESLSYAPVRRIQG